MVDGVAYPDSLAPESIFSGPNIVAGQSVVLQLDVVVVADLPADAVWIESAVVLDCANNDSPEVSDNDVSGHCGILDDGLDHASDDGTSTADDDPTRLPLVQALCTKLAFLPLRT